MQQDLPNGGGGGGAHPEHQMRQPCRPMWQGGVLFRGGGGADASIGPRTLETLTTPLRYLYGGNKINSFKKR